MGKIAIVTDSNSGITQKEGKELGISVIPMPFYINEELYFEDITLTQDEFYQKLNEDEDIKNISACTWRCVGSVGEVIRRP